MKTLRMTVAALGLLALVSANASAQGRGFGGGFGGPGAGLLTNKSVLKELKADDEQTEKLAKAAEEIRAKQVEAMQGFRELSQEERMEKGAEIAKTVAADTDKAVSEALKPEQVKRFKELRYQVMGANAFTDETVAKELKVTDDQKAKIKDIIAEQRSQMGEIFQGFRDDREGSMKKMAELNKETKGKIVALMTEDQKKAWAGLTGAPFEYVAEMPRPRGNN